MLRWDERGVGASTGDHERATTADLADDLEAGVAYLRARPDVHPERVGVLGHSDDGLIAAMVAARAPGVAFVVAMAAPAVPYAEGVVRQVERTAETSGVPAAAVAEAVAQQTRLVALALAEAGNDDVTVVILDDANHLFQRAVTGGVDEYLRLETAVAPGLRQEISSWLRARFPP